MVANTVALAMHAFGKMQNSKCIYNETAFATLGLCAILERLEMHALSLPFLRLFLKMNFVTDCWLPGQRPRLEVGL